MTQNRSGVVGKNYAYQTMSSVNVFFDDKILNPSSAPARLRP